MGTPKRPRGAKEDTTAAKAGLTDAEVTELDKLTNPNRPDVPVKTLLQEARLLAGTATKDEAALVAGTDLADQPVAELVRRTSLMERAEDAWDADRARRASVDVVAVRAQGEAAKSAAFAALRYFLRGDAEVQARLDEIALGTGDADLIDDLRRLGNLVQDQAASLKKAKLAATAADDLRALAQQLADAVVGKQSDTTATRSGDLRNRAFWFLRAWMDEIRAAARYVFRADERRLEKYRSTRTLSRARNDARKKAAETRKKAAKPTG